MALSLLDRLKERKYVIVDNNNLSILNPITVQYSVAVRKALAVKKLLEEVPVRILDGELFAGLRPQMKMPEYATKQEKERAWNVAQLTPDIIYGHNSPSYRMMLEKGFKGVIGELDRLQAAETDEQKNDYREAMKISCEAVIAYANRYANEAESLAEKETKVNRKKELERMADACSRVPENVPENFFEALQAVWIVYSVLRITGHTLVQLGRFDQYLYPFYKKDMEAGVLTREEAKTYLLDFWIKCNMTDYIEKNPKTAPEEKKAKRTEVMEDSKKVYMGTGAGEEIGLQETGNNMILSGQTKDGADATNELSYLCIEVASDLKLRDPIVSVRVHKNTPADFLKKAVQLLPLGSDMPAFYNDEVIIPALQKLGILLEDAREYCNDGCIEVYSQGKSQDRNIAIWIDSIKCLELALNNGLSFRRGITTHHIQVLRNYYATYLDDGELQGPPTGSPEEIKTFDQLFKNYIKQLSFTFERHARLANETDKYIAGIAPCPLFSAMLEGCAESGKDHTAGGARYNNTGTTLRGIPNTAEALAAIKKICFDEKILSLSEMVNVLKNNFKGRDDILRMLEKCPKWGDNDDAADRIAAEIIQVWYKETAKYVNPRGGRFKAGLWATAADHSGQIAAASADGRREGEAISTNMSAVRSHYGPTSILNSAAKMDFSDCTNSTTVDLHIMPDMLDSAEKQEKLLALVKAYFSKGGYALAFNVVNPSTLYAAQEHPELYGDLLVRVHGYSAHFVTLSAEYQDLIIARAGGKTKQKTGTN